MMKALEIKKARLPSDHPLIAESYEGIAKLLNDMGAARNTNESYAKALEYFD